MTKLRILLLVVVATSLTACGITDQDIGQSALLAAPIAVLIGLSLQSLYFRLWKRHYQSLKMNWIPSLVSFIIFLILGANSGEGILGMMMSIVLIPAYLPMLLITIRILLRFRQQIAFTWGLVICTILYFLPAVLMYTGLTFGSPFVELTAVLWTWTSIPFIALFGARFEASIFIGLIIFPALVLLLLYIEPLIRSKSNAQSLRQETV